MNRIASERYRRLLLVWITMSLAFTAAAGEPALVLRPSVIEMGAFYGGTRIQIHGALAAGSQAALVIRGPEVEEMFNKRAKAGPLWINGGKVFVSGVPSLFLCFSSAPLARMLSRGELDANQLDEEAIRDQMRVRPPDMDLAIIRANYLALKRRQGTFDVAEGAVRVAGNAAGQFSFDLNLPWPKRAPPAVYQVQLYECRDGRVTAVASGSLEVREVGFPSELARLAKERAALYGALCLLIAMVAGFGIDFLVTRLGRSNLAGH